jgi:hypothetical protein
MSKSKAQVKEQTETAAPKRKERSEQEQRAEEAARVAKRAETLKVWKEEVQALTSQEFASLDAAIVAVTEQLAKRMGISKQEQEFVQLLFSTDPTLTAELQKSLRIK